MPTLIPPSLFLFSLLLPLTLSTQIVTLPNSFSIKMHSQSSTVIDAFGPLHLINSTSVSENGKPTDLCTIKPANVSVKIGSIIMFSEKNSLVNASKPIYRFEDL